jgi:hypothetical protein
MRTIYTILTIFLCSLLCAEQNLLHQHRVSLVFIELTHADATTLLSESAVKGSKLFERCMALRKEGKATIVDSSILLCRQSQKSKVESNHELIFPIYDQPMVPKMRGPIPDMYQDYWQHPSVRRHLWFENRNTGIMMEVETGVELDGHIDLRMYTEVVTFLRNEKLLHYVDQWGDASRYHPIFERLFFFSHLWSKPGKYELVNALTPKAGEQDEAVQRKILAFVKLDLVSDDGKIISHEKQ